MLHKLIIQELQLLPELAQQEVLNFLLYTKSKYHNKFNLKKKDVKRPTFGCGSVKVNMSMDFDEPLDDFKDYMQ